MEAGVARPRALRVSNESISDGLQIAYTTTIKELQEY
jgi:hypothetical protein